MQLKKAGWWVGGGLKSIKLEMKKEKLQLTSQKHKDHKRLLLATP